MNGFQGIKVNNYNNNNKSSLVTFDYVKDTQDKQVKETLSWSPDLLTNSDCTRRPI